ncbi:MAG: hypothetical protein H0V09_00785 [Gemmatimonadetes bacterium]|nr:hypothetical protein [Gemmatimonadota bacterium]
MRAEKSVGDVGTKLLGIRGDLDQRGFSKRVKVSQQAVSNYERGNVPASWGFLRRLSREFSVDLNWLLADKAAAARSSSTQADSLRRTNGVHPPLRDNRPPGWPRAFLDQPALGETDPVEVVLHVFLLYLATEPADARTRLMADLQRLVADATGRAASSPPDTWAKEREALYGAIARDDRRGAAEGAILLGERVESSEERSVMRDARKLYLFAVGLAKLHRWVDLEVQGSGLVARTLRKEGRWEESERYYEEAIRAFRREDAAGGADAPGGIEATVSPEARTSVLLGYGHVAKQRDDLATARERYLAALESAMASTDKSLRGDVYLDLASLAIREEQWEKALDFVRKGKELAAETRRDDLLIDLRVNEAEVLRAQQRYDRAEAVLRAVIVEAEHSAPRAFPLAASNLAEVLVDSGRVEEALALLEDTEDAAEALGHPNNIALRRLLRARIAKAQGDDDAANAHLMHCLRYAANRGLTEEFDIAAARLEGTSGRPVPS